MSISRHVDDYLADRGLVAMDEVVPDSECQVFDGQVATESDHLDQARLMVSRLLAPQE